MDGALEVVYTLGASRLVEVVLGQLYMYGASHADPGEGEGEYYVVWPHIDCRRAFEQDCGASPSMLLSDG